jgi:hypothetical protein
MAGGASSRLMAVSGATALSSSPRVWLPYRENRDEWCQAAFALYSHGASRETGASPSGVLRIFS